MNIDGYGYTEITAKETRKLALKKVSFFLRNKSSKWKKYLLKNNIRLRGDCSYCQYLHRECSICPLGGSYNGSLCSNFCDNPSNRSNLWKIRIRTWFWNPNRKNK